MARKNPEKAQEIRDNICAWDNYWKDNKDTYNDFNQFVWGNQWLDDEARVFETYKKIPLTMNKIAPLINHMVGEQRQNTPSIECIPDDGIPVQTIDVREALVKEITFESNAKVVYQTGFQCAASSGYGAWHVDTEYESDDSFLRVIRIREAKIPTRYFWDYSDTNPCKTEGMFSGFQTRMSRKKFRAIHGKKLEQDIPPSNLEEGSVFNDDESVTIIDYYERKYNPVTLYKLSNGRELDEDEFKTLEEYEVEGDKYLVDAGEIVTVVDKRKAPRYKVIHYVYAGDYELEKEDFPSKKLPIIFVDMNSFYNKDGTQVIRPFIKDTKDAQRYINYIATQSAYLLKIGRYDQFLIESGNARSPETAQIWRNPVNIQGGLKFDSVQSGFTPQQLKPPELSMSLVQQYERALMDIQSSTGMYNAQLGEQGNEVSGAAVDARTKRGAYSTYIPFDSLNRAIAETASIINEMIPSVYDTERMVSINMKDKGMTSVKINEQSDEYGAQVNNDMTKGKYKIRLVPGPSWEGQKRESLESIEMVLKANPELFNLIADLFVENLPLNNNIELKNRLRTIVPPEIIEAGKTGQPIPPKPPQPDPMMMLKMQELQLKKEQIENEKQQVMADTQLKQEELQLKLRELEAKEAVAAAELQGMELRYISESERTISQEQIAHANNLIKLLTHGSSLDHKTKEMKNAITK
jgi:hypothetical protein